MKIRHLLLVSALAGVGGVPMAWSQAAPTAPVTGPASNNPDSPASIASEKPKRSRAVSDGVAASISASMPKFTPQAKAPEPKPESELPDLRETDKPRNTIIRLPEHVVREKAPPVLRERTVYTKEGMQALARQRYLTDVDLALNRFRIPLFSPISVGGNSSGNATTDRALLMYAEEERLQNMAELNDAAALVSASDKSAGLYIKREAQKTYIRRDDFGTSSPSEHRK
ncbi:MAG TPA: hypothetical protein VHO24_21370 [Opitutaceae bacterium]|nr:hypothetical protein [Opitutaceae bacterium]